MRLGTIYYNNHTIEIHNSSFGTETIYHDGILMSRIKSFRGGFHKFEVEESGEWVTYVILLKLTMHGVSFDVYRDEEPIMHGAA